MAKAKTKKLTTQVQLLSERDRNRWNDIRGEQKQRLGKAEQGEAFAAMLDAYDAASTNAPDAASHTGDVSDLTRELVAESHKLGVSLEAMIETVMTTYHDSFDAAGQGVAKVGAAVRDMMADNARADDWFNRIAITNSAIFGETGTNQTIIRKWLKDNVALIDDHHRQMGIDDPTAHNRAVGQHRRKREG